MGELFLLTALVLFLAIVTQAVEYTSRKNIDDVPVGSTLRINCTDPGIVWGTKDDVQLEWMRLGADGLQSQVTSSSGGFSFENFNGIGRGTLVITAIHNTHEGLYVCTGETTQQNFTLTFEVKLFQQSYFQYDRRNVMGVIAALTIFVVLVTPCLIYKLSRKTYREKYVKGRPDYGDDYWTRMSYDNLALDITMSSRATSTVSVNDRGTGALKGAPASTSHNQRPVYVISNQDIGEHSPYSERYVDI